MAGRPELTTRSPRWFPSRSFGLNLGPSPRDRLDVREKRQTRKRPSFESADSGDFESKDAFSFGAWIKLPKGGLSGSVIARMDDQHDYRGWDLWIEGSKVATHLVNKWPDNALKVVGTRRTSLECLDSRPGHLRRLVPGRRRQDLHQRRASGDRDRRPIN